MKTEKRFVIAFAAVVAACCALCAAGSALSLHHLRQTQNAAVAQLIANLRAREPEMTESEIMQILNAEENTLSAEKLLRSFGISEDSWTVKSSQADSAAVAAVSVGVCLLCGVACFGVFALYKRRQRKRLDRLVSYLAAVNGGSYDLDLDSNSENADSRLQNEIYKTTVTLREAAQQSSESREKLKTALSDISHQLKTPLTSIIITTENLLDNPDLPTELRQEFLRDIYRSSNHISFLVQSLLTLSKLDADSIVLKRKPEPLGDIFSEVTQNIAVSSRLTATKSGSARRFPTSPKTAWSIPTRAARSGCQPRAIRSTPKSPFPTTDRASLPKICRTSLSASTAAKTPPMTAWASDLPSPRRSSKKPAAPSASIPNRKKEAPLPSSFFHSNNKTPAAFWQQGSFV